MKTDSSADSTASPVTHPSFWEAFRFWLKLGFISFGGPAGQIAVMHTELVERRKWISEGRFLHALNFCMLLPGPEAQQLATYIGWLLHRTWGGILAGTLFVLPSALLLWGLSVLYVSYGRLPWVAALFLGLQPAVLAIVSAAVFRIGSRVLRSRPLWLLAAAAFISLFFFKTPFPLVIISAAAIGWLGGRFWPARFQLVHDSANTPIHDETDLGAHTRPSWPRALKVLTISLLLWWAPVVLAGAWLGWAHAIPQQGIFFSKAAMVTFGGAYAVLPYVSQQAVEHYHWLTASQMLDGLGLAETTPGPLIMVLQFVGFLGGWHHPDDLPPLLAATLGAAMTTWTTFVPCFLWIFLGAPYIEKLRGHRNLSVMMNAITASVVGVILNLAVWFGGHVLFPNSQPRLDYLAALIAIIAFVGLVRWRWGIIPVVIGAALLGLAKYLAGF